MARLTGGKVVGWGANEHGELGLGTNTSTSTPVPIVRLSGVVDFSAGRTLSGGQVPHSLAG